MHANNFSVNKKFVTVNLSGCNTFFLLMFDYSARTLLKKDSQEYPNNIPLVVKQIHELMQHLHKIYVIH